MLALLYMVLAALMGGALLSRLWSPLLAPAIPRHVPIWMVFWPAAWLVGTIVLTSMTFLIASASHSMTIGAVSTLVIAGCSLSVMSVSLWRKKQIRHYGGRVRPDPGLELIYSGGAMLIAVFIVFRTLWVEGDALRIGATVFSDFGPHLAVIRSFSEGLNFPPQYPHFPDGTIRYHFMFQFHVATLEVLGLRLDWAFNLPSLFALTSCLMLLYVFAVAVSGSRLVGVLVGVLFVFRSSFAVFTHAAAVLNEPHFWSAFWNPTLHIGATANESWGLFAQNVYANQRHLAFSLGLLWLVLLVVMPLLRARTATPSTWATFWVGSENWWPQQWLRPVVLGLVLGAIGYWNGAVVLAALMILAGIAIVARHRLEFAVIAVLALGLSFGQWQVFAGSSSAAPSAQWLFGFLAEDKTPLGVLRYLIELLGVFLPLWVIGLIIAPRGQRALAVACLFPLIFALSFALTVDINANHKFIMIAVALGNIFVSIVLALGFRHRSFIAKSAAVIGLALLTATGIVDLRTLQILNRGAVLFGFDDPTLAWVRQHTRPGDLFLTHWATLNPVLLAGRPIYYGWPYYAWSAGHPTLARESRFKALYAANDPAQLANDAREEGIHYIVVEWENRQESGYSVNEPVIAKTFPLVFQHPERDIRIYRVLPAKSNP